MITFCNDFKNTPPNLLIASWAVYLGSLPAIAGDDVLLALLIAAGGVVLSRSAHYLIQNQIKRLVAKTDIDDIVLGVLERPLEDAIVLAAVYLALVSVQAFV